MKRQRLGFNSFSFRVYSPTFGGTLNVIRRKRDGVTQHGKASAVNAALDQISGDIVVAIDSDVVLAPTAIDNAVREFMANPDMIAATGHLIIDPYLIMKTDRYGNIVINDYGITEHRPLNASEEFLTGCQFLEYLTTFHLGRRVESATNTMFTMSGACAVFRREVFDQVGKYRGRTVSEDADLTLAIHGIPGKRIGYLNGMEVHLAPVLRWSTLYSQRIRWQRGQLEVSAVHNAKTQQSDRKSFFWRLALPLRLQIDHTLALPRMVWTFLIFMLPLFGYSWTVIRDAYLMLMAFYIGINAVRVLVAYSFSKPPEKVLARRYLKYVFALPVYNMYLYWTRMSAVLRTLTEDATWTVENQFLDRMENGSVYRFSVRAFSMIIGMIF
jgi:cellulose synthase/poly-beta-1,6-N-acetylglucosamine synthase-like glycosyltransferase